MKVLLGFPTEYEQKSVKVSILNSEEQLTAIVRLPIPAVLSHLNGPQEIIKYDTVEEKDGIFFCSADIRAKTGNQYILTDEWSVKNEIVSVNRSLSCLKIQPDTAVRLTSEFYYVSHGSSSFDDYQLIFPGAFYNKNDTDLDGIDDYLGTFCQDYRDDRNPSLSVTCFSSTARQFFSLIRADIPTKDATISRKQIQSRHFAHETDIGSLGFSPSLSCANEVILRCDFPFYERASFCLNVNGDGWSAYKSVKDGDSLHTSYLLQFGIAEDLTSASWETSSLQMNRILDDTVSLPFTLEEARQYRRELIFNSYREYPEKKNCPAGFFMHFSPRKKFGSHSFLEYGFSGAQTLNCYAMLSAATDLNSQEHRTKAEKTIEFFIKHCIAPSGLPNGIYDVEKEQFVYWWTGVLFPFQYSNDRSELERYLGEQVVSSLMETAEELRKIKGNYCRTMTEAMYYLMMSYLYEHKLGREHQDWLEAVQKFCDSMVSIQNEDGSWYRAYTMDGNPIVKPAEWFGTTAMEQRSGVIFPSEVLMLLYSHNKDQKYLDSSRRAAKYILQNYVKDVTYIGGLNDTTNKKSVKIDAVGVMFAMRSLLMVYEHTLSPEFLTAARDAARILASWTYLWDIPFDEATLLGKHGFKTTGWAGCDVIPACSYVDDEFQEFVPDIIRIAKYCKDEKLARLAKIVTRGMQHGLSMPQNMYGYSMPGIQCEGYMTSLWFADTEYREFSGAAAKNKGDDNDTCNGLINAQALYNMDYLLEHFGTLDFDRIISNILSDPPFHHT